MIRSFLLSFLCATSLSGCGGRLADRPARTVDLSGHWAVNRAQSDDSERLMMQQWGRMRGHDGRRRLNDPMADDEDFATDGYRGGFQDRANLMRKMIATFMLNDGQLNITQSNRALVISNGDLATEYVYGQKSIVSMLSGAVDRQAGWQKDTFVVQTRSPDGAGAVQTYQLSPDGRQLITTTQLSGPGPDLTVKRVFDRLP